MPRGVSRVRLNPGARTAVPSALAAAAQPLVRTERLDQWSVELVTRLIDERGRVRKDTASIVADAEADGSIARLDAHVLGLALSLLRDRAPRFARVQVNVSAHSLMTPGFVDEWQERIRTAGAGPGALVLEVSRRGAVAAHAALREPLRALAASGAALALDDATGSPAELDLLSELGLSQVKVSGDVVHAAAAGEAAAVRQVLRFVLCAQLRGITCVAKSVETQAHLDVARDAGFDLVQGHFTGSPVLFCASRSVRTTRPARRLTTVH